ncbi:MAG: ABC transporter ATP-binding protein [Chlorobi bacterium]|nr:ABC transporter ATP-binding protein [Chlorobiota bacterium]
MHHLQRLLPYIGKYRGRLIAGLMFITISNVFSVAIPHFIGQTIDKLGKGLTSGGLAEQAVIIVGLSIGSGIFLYLTRQTIIVLSRLVEYDLRNDFLKHVQTLPMDHFNNTPTGDTMALATNDISAVREFVGPALMYASNTITTLLFALTMMLILSVKITLLALLPLPLVSYTVYRLGKRIHGLSIAVQSQYADLTSNAQENLSGVRVVRAYVREKYAVGVFGAMSEEYRRKNLERVRAEQLMMPAMMVLIGLSQLIVLGVGGWEVIYGDTTIGDIVQFFSYISQLIWPVIAVGWITNLVQRAAASMGRLNRIFELEPEVAQAFNTESTAAASDTASAGFASGNGLAKKKILGEKIEGEKAGKVIAGKIEFRNVWFQYRPGLPFVLKNLSFTVQPGQTLAIIGSTGSGKTTIVNLLARLYEATQGEILIDDRPISQFSADELRTQIGVVAQETFLFSDTIAGNIRFGRRDATEQQTVRAADIAQLSENINRFPEGYQTMVGERGITLSGGQKQRTSIARALLRQPQILMLDDALSAVDTETEEQILRGLRQVMRSRTSILIAHRISTVKEADQILVMDEGEVIEQGTHDELLAIHGEYYSIYERQLLEQTLEAL